MKTIFLISLMSIQLGMSQNSGAQYRRAGGLDGNNIITVFGNWGVIGQPASGGPRGAWLHNPNGYIGDFSIMIGARIPYSDSLIFATVTDCPVNRPSIGGEDISTFGVRQAYEPLTGYFNMAGGSPAKSNDPSTWPLHWSTWPFSNPAPLETFFGMDDNNDNEFNDPRENIWGIEFKPDSTDLNRNGLALKIEARYRQYQGGNLDDIMLLEYDIINEGTTIYRQMIFGGLLGTYVGVTGDDHTPQEYDDDAAFFDIENNYTLFWDWPMDNSRNPFWIGIPGYGAITLIQSPGNPYDGIDNDRDNVNAPGSSAPFFTISDFNGSVIQAGAQIVLIDGNYQRSVITVPNNPFTITTCGKSFDLIPGVTFVQEGNLNNPNAIDGIDNDFDGLIDENIVIHYNFNAPDLMDPIAIANTLGPTQYINYLTNQGLNDPLIDEQGVDIDEIGLTSFDYFVPAQNLPLSEDEQLYYRLTPGYVSLPSSYSNGYLTSGEDGDYLFGSGVFTIHPGDTQKVVLGLVYGASPSELKSKVQVVNAANFNTQVSPNLTLISPVGGIYSGNIIPISFQTLVSEGSIIIEYSANYGRSWKFTGEVPAANTSFDWDISNLDDGAFYQVRIRHSLNPLEIITSKRLVINRPGQTIPQVFFTHYPGEWGQVVSDSVEISWVAADADGDSIIVSLYYSTDPDTNWQFLSNLPDSGSYTIDTRMLPNSLHAILKLAVSDGSLIGEDLSPKFSIENLYPILPDSLLVHVSGYGDGSIEVHIVDSLDITGHEYLVTFNDSLSIKSYNVQDLNTGQNKITNCTQLNTASMGPLFDGVRLLVDDLENAQIDDENTHWSNDSINLEFVFDITPIVLPSPLGTIFPVQFPYDYQIEFYGQVVDTSDIVFRGVNLGIPPIETYFRVKNTITNEFVRFLCVHQGSPATTVLPNDRLYFIEKDNSNIDQLSWPILFTFSGATLISPAAGDSLFIKTLKPFSSADQFQFSTEYFLSLIQSNELIPERFILYQNYPNPFNPVSHIKFNIAKTTEVKLEIFNVLGQKVKTLIDKEMTSGEYLTTWNGLNDFGNPVGTGIYFYRLKAAEFVQTKKMILMK